ncbi:MAG: histidinol-phosphate transaminase [Methanomassiliicoccales archaeon]|nr:histidinol-phosphate transaminase [Methanomassiliicoccales archaeon]NYT14557.1 histidinol-phosphate transaminase [Methanomassiliicoccales archaeon]
MRSTLKDIKQYYNPKYQNVVRMDTSVNVLGPNPVAAKVLEESLNMDINQYPKPYSDDLRKELAQFYDVRPDMVIVGNGSDEVLDVIFKSFLEWGEGVVTPYPSYALHSWFVKVNGGRVEEVDLSPNFQLITDDILTASGKVAILCTPNNPTANTFRRKDVERVVTEFDGPVVVDEAYGEFARESFIPLVSKYDNLIVTRTFSKAYGMAGMRVGYLIASEELTDIMNRVKIPYSLNRVSERMAIAALREREYVDRIVGTVNEQRPKLASSLTMMGFEVFPSETNFMLARSPISSSKLTSDLAERGVLIRDFGSKRMLEDCIRTTIGTQELNELLVEKIEEVLSRCQ